MGAAVSGLAGTVPGRAGTAFNNATTGVGNAGGGLANGSGFGGGGLSGLTGTAGGVNGTGIQGPQQANIQQGTNAQQVQGATANVGNSQQAQQNLLAALQGQNGLGNQSQILAQTNALGSQQNGLGSVGLQGQVNQQQGALNSQLAGANGVGTQTSAIQGLQGIAGQQQATAAQLQGIANGTGPNPAMAQLNQTTGQNVANQAALMAGQRGAGSNVGLIARQAAQQGAATQQQAVGQGATMEAQQQLGALSGLTAQQQAEAGTQQAIGGLGTTQVGQQQAGLSAQAGQANTQVAQQQAQQQAAAQQAGVIAGQQIGQVNQNASTNLSAQSNLLGGLANQNSAVVGSQGNVNSADTTLANTNMQGQQAVVGGLLNSAGGASALASKAQGGMIHMDEGGVLPGPVSEAPPTTSPTGQYLAGQMATSQYIAPPPAPEAAVPQEQGPSSSFGKFIMGQNGAASAPVGPTDAGNLPWADSKTMGYGSQALEQGITNAGTAAVKAVKSLMSDSPIGAAAAAAKGGEVKRVPVMLSEGEEVVPPGKGPAQGKIVKAQSPAQHATKKGNSYANDKIPAKLPPGSVVIPRSVMQGKDPARGAADFVAKVLAKQGRRVS